MAEEPRVGFRSKVQRLRVLYAFDEAGKPVFIETRDHVCHVSDPEQVKALVDFCDDFPDELELLGGAAICEVCFKVVADEFALNGHMRSHKAPASEE